jgi:phospholipase/carboxylesterase
MSADVMLQRPASASHLFLLFHGVGATPEGLAPLGAQLAAAFPQAAVVSVAGPDASDLGAGRQWFSVRGVTEEDRPQRVAATLERFEQAVRRWQAEVGVDAAGTTLVGFSQGAIMALAAALRPQPVAQRVVSLSGRFDQLPEAPPAVRLHFLHGTADPVIAPAHAERAAQVLAAAGGTVTLDLVPGLGHGVDGRTLTLLLARLAAA